MKYLLLSAAMMFCCTTNAANYYFANGGSDAGKGTNTDPWRTLTKFNTIKLAPGDSVLFRRGDRFYGSIQIGQSGGPGNPITLGAYGTGPKPIITGFTRATGWSSIGMGRYQCKLPTASSDIMMVTVDGMQKEVARYPKGGHFLTVDLADGLWKFADATLTSDAVLAGRNWAGAEVVMRKAQWWWAKSKITVQEGAKITYAEHGVHWQPMHVGWGYFLQRDPRFVTTNGDWYFDHKFDLLQMHFGGGAPTGIVQVATLDNIITAISRQYVTITNIAIQGSNAHGIALLNSDHITVTACDITHIGGIAIRAYNTTYLNATSNHITEVNDVGIYIKAGSTNSIIRNNTISNVAVLDGMIWSDNEFHDGGIYVSQGSHSALIENNKLINQGGVGISSGGSSNITIKRNLIQNSCLRVDDAGAIYIGDANYAFKPLNRIVTENIIVNVPGRNDGTAGNSKLAHGIYIDSNTEFVGVTNNTVIGTSAYAISLNGASNNECKGNTTFDARMHLGMNNWSWEAVGGIQTGMKITDNTFVASQNELLYEFFVVGNNDPSFIGFMDDNYWLYPESTPKQFRTYLKGSPYTNTIMPPVAWVQTSGNDINSSFIPIPDSFEVRIEYNASETAIVTELPPGDYMTSTGELSTGMITIPPFRSKVLFRANRNKFMVNRKLPKVNL